MPTFYLIDGYAQFFRAYHAIRTPMTSPVTGEPTNMTFGFVGMLLKLLRGEGEHLQGAGRPTHLAVALDVSGDRGTFRSELYPEYKANRDAPPEDLAPQVERCLSLLKAIGVPTVGAEGFEADDVIATIASEFGKAHPDVRLRIISKDKDLKQLLGDGATKRRSDEGGKAGGVEMYDVHTDVLITADTLREHDGITPAQVVDMLALMGDASDNVPGVPGIGPKTAAQLIAEFGSLGAIIEEVRADKPKKDWKIRGKRRENILAALDVLPLSKKLVTLRRDAPVDLDLGAAGIDALNLAALDPILRELGFNRFQNELKDLLGQRPTSPSGLDRHGPAGFGDSLFEQPPEQVAPEIDGDYTCVRTRLQLDELVKVLAGADSFSIDTETTALRSMEASLAGISFAVEEGRAWYVPVRAPDGESHLDEQTVLDALGPILEDPTKAKIGHNIKYDIIVLRRAGVRLRGLVRERAEDRQGAGEVPKGTGSAEAVGGDSMIASYLIDPTRSSHSMDALALALLGRQNISIKDLIGTGKKQKRFDKVPLDLASPYAAEDADITLRLHNAMAPQIRAMGLVSLYRDVELPLVEVLAELEYNGIRVDPDELDRQRKRLEKEIDAIRNRIHDAAMETLGYTFDIDSPRQLSKALFNKPADEPPGLGIKPVKKTKTGFSTDAEVLQKLVDDAGVDSPIPALVLDYRQLTKLVSTYLVALKDEINDQTGRIHASFNQTVAATGRLSSSDPNLQNIPIRTDVGREIRKAFIAPPGRVLITADYSQIELRLLAHLSHDPNLTDAFQRGEDIHAAVAAQIHGVKLEDVTREQRSAAKMVNFGIVYGITPFGLARRLGCSNAEAGEIITGYKHRFAGITTFLEECVEFARRRGYVETMLKRRRPIPDIDSKQPNRRNLAERMAINSVVQGSAADLIKLAMIDLHEMIAGTNQGRLERKRGLSSGTPNGRGDKQEPSLASPSEGKEALRDVLMLLQIHDELVFEAPADTADAARAVIVDRMQQAMTLDVPLVVDSGISENWFEAK